MYTILAALSLTGGAGLLTAYGVDHQPDTQYLAVAGVVALIVGVLSALVVRDTKRSLR